MTQRSAILALEDGTVFHGVSVGAEGSVIGEVVFNTSMTGYQEILSDPSYSQQLVTLTYPHIGNVGANKGDMESDSVQAQGLIIRDYPLNMSNWRAEQTLGDFLKDNGVVAIAEIDTRALTAHLRDKGAQAGCILTGDVSEADAVAKAKSFPGLVGMDLAKTVTTQSSYQWKEQTWDIATNQFPVLDTPTYRVAAYDFGVKRNILRMLAERGCQVDVFPAETPLDVLLDTNPDGIFLSNGPGDPEPCEYAINNIQNALKTGLPIFGICLGHQLLALASGASTMKMKFGHHGGNHPVQDLDSSVVFITSQNHGFAVEEETLPECLRPTHRSLFDGTLQGIERTDCPAFGFQGHPEASPGPHDIAPLFDRFVTMMAAAKEDSKEASHA